MIKPVKSTLLQKKSSGQNQESDHQRLGSVASFGKQEQENENSEIIDQVKKSQVIANDLTQTYENHQSTVVETQVHQSLTINQQSRYVEGSVLQISINNVQEAQPKTDRIMIQNQQTRSTTYQPSISDNLDYGVIILNQRQVNKYYQWKQEYPHENFMQFMDRLRRGSQNSDNLRTPRPSHIGTKSSGVSPVHMSSMIADPNYRHTVDQYRLVNSDGLRISNQNETVRHTADGRLQGTTATQINPLVISGQRQASPMLGINSTAGTANNNVAGGSRIIYSRDGRLGQSGNQKYSHGNAIRVEEKYTYTSHIADSSKVLQPKTNENGLYPSIQNTNPTFGAPKPIQIQSNSSPNLHKPASQLLPQTQPPPFSQRSPHPLSQTPSVSNGLISRLNIKDTPVAPAISFGVNQSPAVDDTATPHFTSLPRNVYGVHDDANVNVLVVDDYDAVPLDIQRKIEEIATRHGCKPQVVVIADDNDDEDREMDDLMRQVYERVKFA